MLALQNLAQDNVGRDPLRRRVHVVDLVGDLCVCACLVENWVTFGATIHIGPMGCFIAAKIGTFDFLLAFRSSQSNRDVDHLR